MGKYTNNINLHKLKDNKIFFYFNLHVHSHQAFDYYLISRKKKMTHFDDTLLVPKISILSEANQIVLSVIFNFEIIYLKLNK